MSEIKMEISDFFRVHNLSISKYCIVPGDMFMSKYCTKYIPDDDFKGDDNNNSDDSDDDSDNVKSGQSSHCRGTSWEALALVWPRCQPSRAGQTGFPINSSLPRFYSFLHHIAKLAHATSDIFYVIQELL